MFSRLRSISGSLALYITQVKTYHYFSRKRTSVGLARSFICIQANLVSASEQDGRTDKTRQEGWKDLIIHSFIFLGLPLPRSFAPFIFFLSFRLNLMFSFSCFLHSQSQALFVRSVPIVGRVDGFHSRLSALAYWNGRSVPMQMNEAKLTTLEINERDDFAG